MTMAMTPLYSNRFSLYQSRGFRSHNLVTRTPHEWTKSRRRFSMPGARLSPRFSRIGGVRSSNRVGRRTLSIFESQPSGLEPLPVDPSLQIDQFSSYVKPVCRSSCDGGCRGKDPDQYGPTRYCARFAEEFCDTERSLCDFPAYME